MNTQNVLSTARRLLDQEVSTPQPATRKELVRLAEICFGAGVRHGLGAKNCWSTDGRALDIIDRIAPL